MPEDSPTRFTMVPARRSAEPTARRRARRILLALYLAASLSVVALAVALAQGTANPVESKPEPKGRGLAQTAVANFLAGEPLNVPTVSTLDPDQVVRKPDNRAVGLAYRSLTWSGFDNHYFGSKKLGYSSFELHHFLVAVMPPAPPASPPVKPPGKPPGNATPSPTATPAPVDSEEGSDVLQVDVSVLLTDAGPRLAAAPAISEWKGGGEEAAGAGDYSNFSALTTEVAEPVKAQLALWAKAYVTGDSAGLLAVTGDQNAAHRYVGLSGFTVPDANDAVQILSAINVSGERLVVRVRVVLAKAGPAAPGVRPFTTVADFDVLVGAPGGAQPPILAWGPPGSASALEPYSNAQSS